MSVQALSTPSGQQQLVMFGGNSRVWTPGSDLGDLTGLADVFVSVDGASWMQLPQSSLETWRGRAGHAAVHLNGKIFVMGGTHQSEFMSDVWVYSGASAASAIHDALRLARAPRALTTPRRAVPGKSGDALVIVGIVVACCVLLGFIIAAVVCARRRRREEANGGFGMLLAGGVAPSEETARVLAQAKNMSASTKGVVQRLAVALDSSGRSDWLIPIEQLQLVRKVGAGSQASVYKGACCAALRWARPQAACAHAVAVVWRPQPPCAARWWRPRRSSLARAPATPRPLSCS